MLALALRRRGEDDREAVPPRARDLLRRVREPVLEREDRLGADRDGVARGHGGREREDGPPRDVLSRAGRRPPRGARDPARRGRRRAPSRSRGARTSAARPELGGHRVGVVDGDDVRRRVVEDVRGVASVEERQDLLEAVVPPREREVPRDRRVVVGRPAGREHALGGLARRARVRRERHRRQRDRRRGRRSSAGCPGRTSAARRRRSGRTRSARARRGRAGRRRRARRARRRRRSP